MYPDLQMYLWVIYTPLGLWQHDQVQEPSPTPFYLPGVPFQPLGSPDHPMASLELFQLGIFTLINHSREGAEPLENQMSISTLRKYLSWLLLGLFPHCFLPEVPSFPKTNNTWSSGRCP